MARRWQSSVGGAAGCCLFCSGVICFVSAGLVVLSWRWYRRRLQDIAALRQGLADEARELQSFLREK